jgi:hypothetical protein
MCRHHVITNVQAGFRLFNGDGYYSVDPRNRDEKGQGSGMERIYEHGEIIAYARYIMRQFIPPFSLRSARRQRAI